MNVEERSGDKMDVEQSFKPEGSRMGNGPHLLVAETGNWVCDPFEIFIKLGCVGSVICFYREG